MRLNPNSCSTLESLASSPGPSCWPRQKKESLPPRWLPKRPHGVHLRIYHIHHEDGPLGVESLKRGRDLLQYSLGMHLYPSCALIAKSLSRKACMGRRAALHVSRYRFAATRLPLSPVAHGFEGVLRLRRGRPGTWPSWGASADLSILPIQGTVSPASRWGTPTSSTGTPSPGAIFPLQMSPLLHASTSLQSTHPIITPHRSLSKASR